MSSHREAPEISKDPVADNTDLYAFVSPDRPDTVTIIANYVPLQDPAGGPNFFNFGDDVLYEIKIDNNADGTPEITYQFRFTTVITNPNTFLYNTGPITKLDDASWNLRQYYSVTRLTGDEDDPTATLLCDGVPCPPCNIGPRSTPSYQALSDSARFELPTGELLFAGQRADPFYVDLGSVFDLGALRPFNDLHLVKLPKAAGRNGLMGFNVHTIAISVPIAMLTASGALPSDPLADGSVLGIWASASRQTATVFDEERKAHRAGPWQQVSRLGNPLVNEVIIPMSKKDAWNRMPANRESLNAEHYTKPELAQLLPVLYPGVFPKLDALNKSGAPRADLAAILLTGIPAGLIPGFQNFTGTTQTDQLRLNVAIPPSDKPNAAGLVGGDAAGFPNGRRLADNVVAIELRAVAGAVYGLVDKAFTPDDAAGLLTDGTDRDAPYLSYFPYVGYPYSGYDHRHDPMSAA